MSDMTNTSPAAVKQATRYLRRMYGKDYSYAALIEALSAQLAAANARAEQARDAALVEAADEYLRGSGGDSWDFFKAARDAILALRDKPAETAPQPDLCSTSEPQTARAATVRDSFSTLVADARNEAKKAMQKFPQPNYVLLKFAEEAGEVVKAAVHFAEGRETRENVQAEMRQAIAMLYRLWVEGDEVNGVRAIAGGGDE